MNVPNAPGFTAEASLYNTSGLLLRQELVSEANRSIILQLMPIGGDYTCYGVGEDIICYEGEAGGGGGRPGGGGAGAKASCLSGDGSKLCHCPRNCGASQYTCWCY